MPPPPTWAPPGLAWTSWGQFFMVLLLLIIVIYLLLEFFNPRTPGERPSTISMIIMIIVIIIVIALIGFFLIIP